MIRAPSLAVLPEHRLGGLSATSVLLTSLHRYKHLPSRGGDAQQIACIPVTGRVARWSVSVALCRNILHIRLVVCVGRDAKERRLERRRPIEVEVWVVYLGVFI